MTFTVANVNINTDKWLDLISKLNDVIEVVNDNAVTVGGNPAVGNAAIHGNFYSNSIVTISFTADSLTSNTADITSVNVGIVVANQASIGVLASNNATIKTANVTTVTSNTATIKNLNANNITTVSVDANAANVITITSNTATIKSISVGSTLTVNVGGLKVAGGNTTHKFLTTDGSSTLKFDAITTADVTGLPTFISNTNTQLSQKMVKSANLSDVANTAAARSNLGLTAMATQDPNNVVITGGSISNVNITNSVFAGDFTFDGGTY